MEKTKLIEEIFLDSLFGRKQKERAGIYFPHCLFDDDPKKFFATFRYRFSKQDAIIVRVHINLYNEHDNVQLGLTHIKTVRGAKHTRTFYSNTRKILGRGLDEIIRDVAPVLAERLSKAQVIYNAKKK